MTGTWMVYDKEKTYFDENGNPIDYEKMLSDFPVAAYEEVIIKTAGLTILEKHTVEVVKSMYNIIDETDPTVIAQIASGRDLSEQTESSPLERIAAALEYFMMLNYNGE